MEPVIIAGFFRTANLVLQPQNDCLGISNTFWVYAVICAAGFVFILFRLPETKGKTLEQIERELVD